MASPTGSSAVTAPLSALPPNIVLRIRQRLTTIEKAHDVNVLHAVESGSRAWGFASRDSDYDGRFLYVHKPEWYFSVFEKRDVIETPIEDEGGAVFDVNGWDLRKALRLLAKSNPILIEWLQSPIVYAALSPFAEEMLVLAKRFHKPKTAHYHYFHMARKNFQEHLSGDRVKLKKYFYVIRPVLACLWIERERRIPPMTLSELIDGLLPHCPIREQILLLRERKMRESELGDGPAIPAIQDFLRTEIARLSKIAAPDNPSADMGELDLFLRRWARAPCAAP